MSFSSNPMFSAAIQGIGNGLQSAGQSNALRQQAAVADENARLSLLAGEQEVSTVNRKARAAMGEQIASMAGSGFVPNAGSAADLITASSLDAARDVANIRTKASEQAANYETEAAAKRDQAHAAIINGLFGSVAGAIKATGTARNQRMLDSATSIYRNAVNAPDLLGGSVLGAIPGGGPALTQYGDFAPNR
ncbi:hypothetical protein [Novosphingobium sp.]|uniref:hypothetical protein n=1 Tax=Novosphingobium sp. TaxID=1874826 RepID=UPI0031DA8EDA